MRITHDTLQKVSIIFTLIISSYTVIIGSFYCLFVPQSCPDKIFISNSTAVSKHTCSLTENFTDLTTYNWVVLIFNAVTAAVLLVAFGYEYYRENWMVDQFDADESKPDNNLEKEIELYPEIKQKFIEISYRYYLLFLATAIFNVVNMILSAILIFYFYYDGNQSITTFITNTIIIVTRLSKSIKMSQINKDRIKAESVFLTEQVEFNIVGNIPTPVSSPASTTHSKEVTIENIVQEEKEIELEVKV
jgi:hypothetical protein